MGTNNNYSRRQRMSAWIMLTHYIFSLLILTIPTNLRAQIGTQNKPQHFILYHNTAGKNWLQIQQELAPEILSLEQNQKQLAEQYGLTLNDTLLLPDTGPQTWRYPGVTLVHVDPQENINDIAFRYRISLPALKELNSKIKSPEQLRSLAGQWVVVPHDHEKSDGSPETDDLAGQVRDRMAAVWGSAQSDGAGNALRSAASGAVNTALTQEVEAWLNQTGGKARVTGDAGLGNSDSRDFGLDYLLPVKIWQHDTLFSQMSAHRWNERNIVNLGLGWRHTFTPHLLAGGNVFFDQDTTRHHNRLGLGSELWADTFRASANYYIPLSGWRHSGDSIFNDDPKHYELYERAARGWDINVETALSQHVSGKVGWFQWYGDNVDVTGSRSEASHNPHGLNLGVNWKPVPLVSVSAEQHFISGQSDSFSVGLDFHWEFGRTLSEMLRGDVTAMPSLMQSGNEFVTRENNIVLAYKKREKDLRLYFDPTELSVKAGGTPFIHRAQGGQGGVIHYQSSNEAIAEVDAMTGRVTPLKIGQVSISATEYEVNNKDQQLGNAQYHLSVLPGDSLPSVKVIISSLDTTGSPDSLGQTLTGHYTYISNEGYDEAKSGSLRRWFYADDPDTTLSENDQYTVTVKDASRTLVYQVIPVNSAGVQGLAGQATEHIPGLKLTKIKIKGLSGQGVINSDDSVTFSPESANNTVLLEIQVQNALGQPMNSMEVYWSSQGKLGALSNDVTLTDSTGNAVIELENITHGGTETLSASLVKAGSGMLKTESSQTTFDLKVMFDSAALTGSPVTATYGDPVQALATGGGNGGPLSYASDNESVVKVDKNGTLTFTGAGSATVTVSQAANGNTAAPADLKVKVTVYGALYLSDIDGPEILQSTDQDKYSSFSITVTRGGAPASGIPITYELGDEFQSEGGKAVVNTNNNGVATIKLRGKAKYNGARNLIAKAGSARSPAKQVRLVFLPKPHLHKAECRYADSRSGKIHWWAGQIDVNQDVAKFIIQYEDNSTEAYAVNDYVNERHYVPSNNHNYRGYYAVMNGNGIIFRGDYVNFGYTQSFGAGCRGWIGSNNGDDVNEH
ncbi:hypothetical protein L465_00382 [Enterobacter sp. BIDMC 29]|uniref:inverse autotransporter beta domain-containing protein n=1 Tax=Enterobacter sp. BIDMC 29 TaxID=1329841 RepID=UPI000447CCC3|nr:inverse autotransporter beta domain-containing protein [Enterobacter sp. BIDMC 29]EUM16568.1 hypothetical protein L465_00382 [Enterobacter sp. BIDMC 29]